LEEANEDRGDLHDVRVDATVFDGLAEAALDICSRISVLRFVTVETIATLASTAFGWSTQR